MTVGFRCRKRIRLGKGIWRLSAFERLLAIADEETLDLARALLANPPEHISAQTNRILRLCRSR